jgi:hypothetical protein
MFWDKGKKLFIGQHVELLELLFGKLSEQVFFLWEVIEKLLELISVDDVQVKIGTSYRAAPMSRCLCH